MIVPLAAQIDELEVKLKSVVNGIQLKQVAVYVGDTGLMEYLMDGIAGDWVRDTAVHYGMFFDPKHECGWMPIAIKSYLAFNYDALPGREFEFMHWDYVLHDDHKHPFSHVQSVQFACVSYRVESVHQEEQNMLREHGIRPLYRFVTQDHTNPNVVGKARYMDSMFDYKTEFGYLRCVGKIPWEPYYVVPLGSGLELNPFHWGNTLADAYQDENGRWIRNSWK